MRDSHDNNTKKKEKNVHTSVFIKNNGEKYLKISEYLHPLVFGSPTALKTRTLNIVHSVGSFGAFNSYEFQEEYQVIGRKEKKYWSPYPNETKQHKESEKI